MQSMGAVFPELDPLDRHPVAAPVRGPLHRAVTEALGLLAIALEQVLPEGITADWSEAQAANCDGRARDAK